MSRPPRRLFLHLSALSDEEYNTYISALRDVIDDEDELARSSEEELENRVLGVREVRAWMKGRYRDVHDIDKILRLFSPDLLQKDTITGGQFLAALRLVMHTRAGEEVAEGNVFVQATPMSPTSSSFAKLPPTNESTVVSAPDPERTNPFRLDSSPNAKNLPSRRQSISHLPPTSTQSVPASSASDITFDASLSFPSPTPKHSPGNPFLQRSKSSAGTPSAANALGIGSAGRGQGRTPPLPPRKPQHFQSKTPAGGFSVAGGPAASITSPLKPAIIPTPQRMPSFPHRESAPQQSSLASSVSPLMKQSLEASKMGQTLKKVQDQLEKERVLEVIRSSSGASTSRGRLPSDNRIFGNGQYSTSGHGHRPVPSPPRSIGTSGSVISFEQVASATIPSAARHHSPDRMTSSSATSRSSTKPSMDLPPPHHPSSSASHHHVAPPTHPDRRPSNPGHRHASSLHSSWPSPVDTTVTSAVSDSQGVSPTGSARAARSQSMHQPSSTKSVGRASPPLPPPRRQRPESMQVISTPRSGKFSDSDMMSPFANAFAASSKNSSPTREAGSTSETGLSSLTRQLALSAPARSASPERGHSGTSPASSTSGSLSFSALQRTFSQLQSKAQPRIDRARYKAEAGLSRRGFVTDDEPILRDNDDYAHVVERGRDGSPDIDGGDGGIDLDGDDDDPFNRGKSGGGIGGPNGRARRLTREDVGMDDLKMPEGDGWTRL